MTADDQTTPDTERAERLAKARGRATYLRSCLNIAPRETVESQSERAINLLALDDEITRLTGLLAERDDEHHTMDELYEYRMLYNAHAAHGWLAAGISVVKSWRHSDGEECFGGGWFIVVATLPTGQVSNHYAAEHWDLFDVPAADLPPEYDGHTPQDAAARLRAALDPQEDHRG